MTFKMLTDGKGFKALAQSADGLRAVMRGTIEQAETLKKSLINWSACVQGLQSVSNAVGQLSSQLSSITAESGEFNKAMREANTMAGKDAAGFKKLKGQVAELSKEIPIARDQLANGLYQTISNGVPENNWLTFLEVSARSAVGGLADINKVVGVTSTLIKNYGLEWSAAADIQDKIQLTAKNGVTSFEQLADALPRVAGNAATLGVSINELMATFATLTGVSGNTAEVSTQLAAIFTALVKPSSEATKMAAEMGIQFDAAAVKAAGGFQKFLTQLDSDVKAFAQSSGVLEQEVYSRLFGSAEALRALVPLQGELASKFSANISTMVNSAGTMDKAFQEMGSTGEAEAQKLQNKWASVIDTIAGFTAPVQPLINFGAGALSAASSLAILTITLKNVHLWQKLVAISTKTVSAMAAVLGVRGKSAAQVMHIFSSAMRGGAMSAAALKIALRGLLASTGVGLVIWAITAAIEYFSDATDDAADSVDKLIDEEERAKRHAEQLAQAHQQEWATLKETRKNLQLNIAKLKEFNGTKEEEKRLVSEMNDTYGATMGYFSSVSDWYKTLIANSEAYCRQLALEADARRIANQIAELHEENHNIQYDENGNRRKYSYVSGETIDVEKEDGQTRYMTGSLLNRRRIPEPTFQKMVKEGKARQDKTDPNKYHIVEGSDLGNANKALEQNKKQEKALEKQLADTVKASGKITYKRRGSKVRPDTPVVTPSAPSGTGKGRGKGRGTSAGTSAPAKVEGQGPVYDPNATTLKGFRENIAYLDKKRETLSSFKDLKENSAERIQWEQLIKTYENFGKAAEKVGPVYNENATSVKGLRENIQALNKELENTSDPKKAAEINAKKRTAEEKLDKLENAGSTPQYTYRADAGNLSEIEENISYLQEQLQTASITEAARLNQEIALWQKKAEAIRNAGMEAKANFDTYRNGWNAIKDAGSGIDAITGALEGNGNAWQKVTGIVDGFLQIYDGIKGVLTIVDLFRKTSEATATAKTVEAGATVVATGATAISAATADTAAAAQAPLIAANKEAAASYMELAASAFMAAHADIPFVGFALGAGFTSAAATLVKSVGKTIAKPFANGGIVSGPTVGLIGEYAGASNNPEVVAPLDKLRNLIRPASQPVIVGGTLRASGRDLVCVLANETRITGKSGKRTGIII